QQGCDGVTALHARSCTEMIRNPSSRQAAASPARTPPPRANAAPPPPLPPWPRQIAERISPIRRNAAPPAFERANTSVDVPPSASVEASSATRDADCTY